MRKEYNDRWNAPLVNPGFTEAEYQERKAREAKAVEDAKEAIRPVFIPMVDGKEAISA
jgi:hypothetical protein